MIATIFEELEYVVFHRQSSASVDRVLVHAG